VTTKAGARRTRAPPAAMTTYQLSGHLHFCEVDGSRVFLDLPGDRYFMLAPAADADFAAVLRGDAGPGAERLLRSGILVRAPGGRPISAPDLTAPECSLVEDCGNPQRASASRILEIWLLVLAARRALAARRLPALIARASRGQPDPAAAAAVDSAAAQFLAARRYVPAAPGCLHDSLALSRYLARRGLAASLVIGVRLHPFGAHCWVQHGGTVLNDTLSAARGFQPVLVA